MTQTAVAHGGATPPDGVLVQEAAAGSGVSYGELYDRYAEQVYNYCLRLTGSPDDAGDATQEAFVNVLRRLQEDDRPVLDFSSYLFASARHEAYGLMRQRSRLQPSESPPEERGRAPDVETDPERAALLRDTQEAVKEANAKLAPRHREVLALREVAGRSYDEVGEIMGISGNAAAQLIFRARGKLREALTAGAVASVVATTEDCEYAQLLLSRVQDGEAVDEDEREWLAEHLEECGSCQTANRMLLEAGASYRMWAPVALFAAMRTDTLTAAGSVVGADWSGVAAPQAAAGSSGGGGVVAAAGAVIVAAGIAFLALTGDDKVANVTSPSQPAVETPAKPAKSSPAKPDRAKQAAVEPILFAARAPSAAPAVTKPAAPPKKADKPAPPQSKGAPPAPEPKAKPPAPKPAVPAPPVQRTPAGPCSWPGHGSGPGGCPPGHGGVPPGHGGTPPGQSGAAATPKGKARGQGGTQRGLRGGGTPGGAKGAPPGHGGTPRGHAS
ncbi:MAG TPA: sigma-70 family RNA polymerase sigma factor [Thermoleophilaceae bacterium]|nr:sigma-70 family RNA polymerase sigma factor [Thermoleophilaceae bacterium]